MTRYTYHFQDLDQTTFPLVGGKGARLGELSRIAGLHVPEGFCVSTEAFKKIVNKSQPIRKLIEQLSRLRIEEQDKIKEFSADIRFSIEGAAIPEEVRQEVIQLLRRVGEKNAYAVRSSATAEDLPAASFAGQHDTFLNVFEEEEILKCISRCWASLFTERAVTYRLQNHFDHRRVHLAVVVQKMVVPQVSGIMFTADPVTSNRKLLSIDASFGLGETLVSGIVRADNFKVRDGRIIERRISAKEVAIVPLDKGGTAKQVIPSDHQARQALSDDQAQQLALVGRRIESHFGSPQDIEWCLAEDTFYIVQSRPITTLYPIPEAKDDKNHVYISVGHQQMMTDAMKPLGLSAWQFTANAPMLTAGGRLFVDVTPLVGSPAGRENTLSFMGKFDPLIKDALAAILERDDFIPVFPDKESGPNGNNQGQLSNKYQTLQDYPPTIVHDLISRSEASIETLKQVIQHKAGPDLFDFIREDIGELKRSIPESIGVIMTAINASSWINEKIEEWLGEKNVADTLAQSVDNNITSEMGLALLDVADAIRPYPEVISYLSATKEDSFLKRLAEFEGGEQAQAALNDFLHKYGMRCAGEIDITRTRWSEKPATLVPLILSNIKNFEAGAGKRKFAQGRQEALRKEAELLAQLRGLSDGEQKAAETKRMISLLRNFAGYREYPKYSIVKRYFVYKQALLKETERLVQAGVILQKDDIYYLTFDELQEAVRTCSVDYGVINQRKEAYRRFERLTPPRVITSDGEILNGSYKRANLPPGVIAGLAVSSGVIEGRARVLLKMEEASLQEGDILVTRFTDPSWTPLFLSVKGLVTEVGGLMTHGAVIAREYGLPAIVGVENATKIIQDGQRIRLNGTEGYIELLT